MFHHNDAFGVPPQLSITFFSFLISLLLTLIFLQPTAENRGLTALNLPQMYFCLAIYNAKIKRLKVSLLHFCRGSTVAVSYIPQGKENSPKDQCGSVLFEVKDSQTRHMTQTEQVNSVYVA